MRVKKLILTQKMNRARIFMLSVLWGLMLPMTMCVHMAQADTDEDASAAMNAGAAELALSILDRATMPATQPQESAYLRLQWQALAEAGTPQAIVDHAAKLPPDTPDDVQHAAAILNVRAALALGNGALAQASLARLFWQWTPAPAEMSMMRALVVRSHLLPHPDSDAASLMLRDQQDFGVDPALQKAYVLAVLQSGQKTDLSGLRASLADNDPLAVLMDASQRKLFDSTVHGRMALLLQNKNLDLPTLQVIRKIVTDMNSDDLSAAVNERLLNFSVQPQDASAEQLWKSYHDMTQSFGNVRLLLFGSDAGWAEQAQSVLVQNPVMARAIWSYLARDAKDPALKIQAQQQLLDLLAGNGLPRTALRLFAAAWPDLPPRTFAPPVRFRLGQLALDTGDDAHAAQLWEDASILPEGADLMAWQVTRAKLYARVQAWSKVTTALSSWLVQPQAMTSSDAWDMVLLAEQLSQYTDQAPAGQKLLLTMYPAASAAQQRYIALRLGKMMDELNPKDAALWYLRATGDERDALTWRARRDAAASLAKAGLHEDAKHLDQLILSQCPDAALQAEAREALAYD
ncbi:MAG: hypothetical protein M0Z83_04950 [Betaproteobacteria bacterium]|nr:hypothetical protein [Betaproteobacteria bacterium]